VSQHTGIELNNTPNPRITFLPVEIELKYIRPMDRLEVF